MAKTKERKIDYLEIIIISLIIILFLLTLYFFITENIIKKESYIDTSDEFIDNYLVELQDTLYCIQIYKDKNIYCSGMINGCIMMIEQNNITLEYNGEHPCFLIENQCNEAYDTIISNEGCDNNGKS